MSPHVRDVAISGLADFLRRVGVERAEAVADRLRVDVHLHGALDWEDVRLGRARREAVQQALRLGPQLELEDVRVAGDGTRKYLFGLPTGEAVEVVLLRNARALTACVSSQAGCALGCTFCATAELGLFRNLTAGQITEGVLRAQRDAGARVSDIVFMGQGEPLQNFDAVMTAAENFHLGLGIARKRISISTSGLTPQIRRYTDEERPWRLYLSLHSAIQEVRERIMPIARTHPLEELLDAMRAYQRRSGQKWLTLQYVALPNVNMDDAHVDALARRLQGLRYILNVIPWNDTGAAYRPPTWEEVKDFTTRLRRLEVPVKIRYSGGKREGMGCGQLAAEMLDLAPSGGHHDAPPGIFT